VPNTSRITTADLQEANARNLTARDVLAELASVLPSLSRVWRILDASLIDTPVLTSEIYRLATDLAEERRSYADLLAAARATLSAAHDAEPDPLFYLRDELSSRGQLPPTSEGRGV
jgi:hypothetical protein